MQVFRGVDGAGNYVADVTGLEGEQVEIPGAANVECLLQPFWENGQHSAIPSIEKQKVFVADQMRRFADLHTYPCTLSDGLTKLRDDLTERVRADSSGWEKVLSLPEEVPDQLVPTE